MAKQKKSKMALYTKQDKIILYCGYALLGLFLLAIIVPMIYIVIASFMDPVTLQNKGISFDFSKWSLDAYQRVVSDKQIWVGFKNAVLYSIIFTIVSVAVTMLAAYPMSLPDFKGKKIFNTLFVITMFFSGGLIPWYMTISKVGLIDNFWALILPSAVSVYNVIILMNFFRQLPQSVLEAAYIDGASHFRTLFQVVVPMSLPSIATLTLFSFVTHWNSWFDGLLLMNSPANYPLQSYLQTVIVNRDMSLMSTTDILTSSLVSDSTSKAAQTFVAALPVMIIYPFLQKYFAAGIQLGSVKE